MKFVQQPELLYSRGGGDDARLGDVTQMPTLRDFGKQDWDIALVGFPDDRGVALNGGNPGAISGPREIRSHLYRLIARDTLRIADLGDLVMTDDLAADHRAGIEAIALGLSRAGRVIVLGGGHDWGYAPIGALLQAGRTGFVNMDAHLDVRASDVHHSGTSYWRALEGGVRGEDAVWFGVQSAATATAHSEYVKAKGGTVYERDSAALLKSFAEIEDRCEHVELSLDMDVFAMSAAPGVSAPQPAGLSVESLLPVIRALASAKGVKTFGIYETAPPRDQGSMTSMLAARCAWSGIFRD